MIEYHYFKKYKFDVKNEEWRNSKQAYFEIDPLEIDEAEEMLGQKFPASLRLFYKEIGYGFPCNKDNIMIGRMMDPMQVAELWKGKQTNEDNSECNLLDFFEVDEESYIYLDLDEVDSLGDAAIYYHGIEVAKNLKEFLMRLERRPNYYINLARKVMDSEKQ